jgi:serine/threonine protein kinase
MMRHVAKCLLRAVAYLHDQQLYHGDLSPRNILVDCLSYDLRMLTKKSKIVIADGGSVTAAHRRHAPCGDLRFQSPESVIVQTNYASREHDVWMVGASLMFLTNGKQVVNYESRFAHDGASYCYIDRFGRKTYDVTESEMRAFVRRNINKALDDKSGYVGSVTRCAAKFLHFYPEHRKLLGKQ